MILYFYNFIFSYYEVLMYCLFINYTYCWRFIFFIFLLNYLIFFLLIYRSSFIWGISDIYILHISFTLHTDTLLTKSALKETIFDSEMLMEYSRLFSLWLVHWEESESNTISGLSMSPLLGGDFVRALLYSQPEQLVLGRGSFLVQSYYNGGHFLLLDFKGGSSEEENLL